MSSDPSKDPNKRHRHDVGDVDHGPKRTVETTEGLQIILGSCIILSTVLVVYTIIAAGSG